MANQIPVVIKNGQLQQLQAGDQIVRPIEGDAYITGTTAATWVGIRYFAVDYDAGLDTNLGYSDVSLAAAGLVALKTLEKMRDVLPRFGNGQKAVLGIKTRAAGAVYRNIANTADDELQIIGIAGYKHLLIRGTATDTTAASVAFANDVADKIFCGARRVAGTETTGYNPVAAFSASTIKSVRAVGGADPAYAAEPALLGKRIRFDAATTTVALQNICRMVHEVSGTDTIIVDTNLPATPVGTDVFYIEEPGVAVDRIQVHNVQASTQAFLPSFAQAGLSIAGIRMPNATAGFTSCVARSISGAFQLVFCESASPGFSAYTMGQISLPVFQNNYTDELETARTVGVGIVAAGWLGTLSSCPTVIINSTVSRLGRFQILNIGGGAFSVGGAGGCYMGAGLLFQNCKGSGGTQNTVGGNLLGSNASATVRRTRLRSGFAGACLSLTNTDAFLRGLDIQSVGALNMIECRGIGSIMVINDVVGSTGNTGIGLDLSLNRYCQILLGQLNANTFTATAGKDIRGRGDGTGGVFYVHADYALTDLQDSFANHIQGTASTRLGSVSLFINNGAATIGQYKVVRASASGTGPAAQADTAGNAAGVVGVTQSSTGVAAADARTMIASAGPTWIQFDAAPTAGSIAYLSTATIGNAQVAIPAVAGTNQKLRLGRVLLVSGTLGLVQFHPDTLAVLADGLA